MHAHATDGVLCRPHAKRHYIQMCKFSPTVSTCSLEWVRHMQAHRVYEALCTSRDATAELWQCQCWAVVGSHRDHSVSAAGRGI